MQFLGDSWVACITHIVIYPCLRVSVGYSAVQCITGVSQAVIVLCLSAASWLQSFTAFDKEIDAGKQHELLLLNSSKRDGLRSRPTIAVMEMWWLQDEDVGGTVRYDWYVHVLRVLCRCVCHLAARVDCNARWMLSSRSLVSSRYTCTYVHGLVIQQQ